MDDYGLRPEPPRWALEAGLPEPKKEEGFAEYVTRLGLDAEELLVELTAQTAPLANGRLATTLARAMPGARDRYIEHLVSIHIDPLRRLYLEDVARSAFGVSFRRRRRPSAV